MNRAICALVAAIVALVAASAAPAASASRRMSLDRLPAFCVPQFGETPLARYIAGAGSMMELYASPTGTVTLVEVSPPARGRSFTSRVSFKPANGKTRRAPIGIQPRLFCPALAAP